MKKMSKDKLWDRIDALCKATFVNGNEYGNKTKEELENELYDYLMEVFADDLDIYRKMSDEEIQEDFRMYIDFSE